MAEKRVPTTDKTQALIASHAELADVHSISRSVTFVVAASDAPDIVKAQADYVCDGTDDHVEIQAALDALPSTGGEIRFSEGTFHIEQSCGRNISNIKLRGAGRSTIFTTSTTNLVFFSFVGSEGNELEGIDISDLQIDGADIADAGVVLEYVNHSVIHDVQSDNCYGEGGTGNWGAGIVVNHCRHNILQNNKCRGNYWEGICLLHSTNNIIKDNIANENMFGIALYTCDNNLVSGNITRQNKRDGIHLYFSNDNVVNANSCIANSQASNNFYSNILLREGCNHNSVQNNLCRAGSLTNKPKYGIDIYSSNCSNNKVINNDLYDDGFGTAPFNDAGTDTIYVDPSETEDAIAKKHDRSHAITSPSDHTSSATPGQILKADTNGLPVNATNTDTEVSNAVTKAHDRQHAISSTSDHTVTGLTANQLLRVNSAGTVIESSGKTAPSGEIVGTSDSQTLTNKRMQLRVSSAASGDISPDISAADMYIRTAQAAALTINNPSGSPVNGERLFFRLKDDGTNRAITFGSQYRGLEFALPTTTVGGKLLYMGFMWNAADTKWDLLAINQEP